KHGKRHPIPGQRAHAREQRIGEDRKGHRALASEIVGKHAAEQAADRPAEYGYRNDRAGIGGGERGMGRVPEVMPRHPNPGQNPWKPPKVQPVFGAMSAFHCERSSERYHGEDPTVPTALMISSRSLPGISRRRMRMKSLR